MKDEYMHNTELNKDKPASQRGSSPGGRYRLEEYLLSGELGNTFWPLKTLMRKWPFSTNSEIGNQQ